MTTLGKTLFAVAAIGALVTIGFSVRGGRSEPKPVAAAQLTPEQRSELFHPQAPPAPKATPAIQFEPPSPGLTPEDGDGS